MLQLSSHDVQCKIKLIQQLLATVCSNTLAKFILYPNFIANTIGSDLCILLF